MRLLRFLSELKYLLKKKNQQMYSILSFIPLPSNFVQFLVLLDPPSKKKKEFN